MYFVMTCNIIISASGTHVTTILQKGPATADINKRSSTQYKTTPQQRTPLYNGQYLIPQCYRVPLTMVQWIAVHALATENCQTSAYS